MREIWRAWDGRAVGPPRLRGTLDPRLYLYNRIYESREGEREAERKREIVREIWRAWDGRAVGPPRLQGPWILGYTYITGYMWEKERDSERDLGVYPRERERERYFEKIFPK